jgi:VCBS repeat-containing protein
MSNPINGTSGADTLPGTAGDDVINGLGGNDKIDGGAGADQIDGGAGADIIKGGDGDDVITGGLGNDNIVGGAGLDTAVFTTAIAAASSGAAPIGSWSGALLTLATGAEGTDILNSVETLRLGGMDFAVTGYNGTSPLNVVANLGADSAGGQEGGAAVSGNVLANDYDVDSRLVVTGARGGGAPAPAMPVDAPKQADRGAGFDVVGQHGTLHIDANGAYTYAQDALGFGVDHFEYSVVDGGVTRWVSLDITVNHVNHAPVATVGSAGGNEDATISGAVSASDVDHDNLTYSLVGGPAHGSLSFHSDGTYSYTPNADYNDSDNFTYKANDGTADSNAATVNLTVNPVNDAPVIDESWNNALTAFNVDQPGISTWNVVGHVTAGGNVQSGNLVGDGGVSPELLQTLTGLTPTQINAIGPFASATVIELTYTASVGTTGVEFTFQFLGASPGTLDRAYVTSDRQGGPAIDYFTLTHGVQNWNNGLRFTVGAGGAGRVEIILLDYAGDAGPSTLLISNAHEYIPGQPFLAVGVPLTISGAGTGIPTINEDGSISGQFHAADVDGDALTFSIASGQGPQHGAVTMASDGHFTYTPSADYNGSDSFTYQVSDGHGGTDSSTYHINILPVNDLPVAASAAQSMDEDHGVSGSVAASDVDGDSLTYSLVSGATHGSLSFHSDGTYSYTPNANYHGADSFQFSANDGTGDSNTATVDLTVNSVNDAPVIDEAAAGVEVQVFGHSEPGSDPTNLVLIADQLGLAETAARTGLSEDYITGLGDFLGAVVVTLTFNIPPGLNAFIYGVDFTVPPGSADVFGEVLFGTAYTSHSSITPAFLGASTPTSATFFLLDYAGDDSVLTASLSNLRYGIYPADWGSALALNALAAPVEDTPFSGQFHASDVDGDILTFSLVAGHGPAHGSASVNADGSFAYTPDANFHGSDSFQYQVSDGHGGTDTATYSFRVAGVNDTPVASDGSASGGEDSDISGHVSASDVDGDNLTYSLASGPAHGSLSFHSDGSFTYTPDANFHGSDSFAYVANDGTANSNTATVNLVVDSVNDAPVANRDSRNTDEDTAISGHVHASDADGDTLTYELVGPAPAGLIFQPDGTWTFDPTGVAAYQSLNEGQSANAVFSFRAFDGAAYSAPASWTIHIGGVNEPISGTAGQDNLTGDNGADTINGLSGNDVIHGLGGADHLLGGDGIDKLYGGDGDDSLDGGAGNDTLNGEAGVDQIHGGEGNDTIDGGDSDDFVYGDNGDDVVKGGAGSDHVYGGVGNDDVQGGTGDDFVYGGAGADRLSGALGADVFVFFDGDLTGLAGTTDRITDFKSAQGDTLDLSGIDADTGLGGDQAFSLVGGFSHHAGEMTLSFAAGTNTTTLAMDTNGDGAADYLLLFDGNVSSTAGWVL